MAKEAPTYDLTLLLSLDAEEGQRSKILSDVESAISSVGGTIERNDEWGRRPLAYEIRHQSEAEYHLLQFKAPPTLIDELSHNLRITDGVVRLRVIKLRRGTPPAPSSPPPVVAGSASSGGQSGSSAAPAATASAAPGATTSAAPGATTSAAPGATTSAAPGANSSAAPGANSGGPGSAGEAAGDS